MFPAQHGRSKINNVLITAVDPYGQNAALILGR